MSEQKNNNIFYLEQKTRDKDEPTSVLKKNELSPWKLRKSWSFEQPTKINFNKAQSRWFFGGKIETIRQHQSQVEWNKKSGFIDPL